MTNEGMWKEVELADKLKEAKAEIKRHKQHIEKLSNQLLDYERIIEERDNEIIIIKNRWKEKNDWVVFRITYGTTSIAIIFSGNCSLEIN